MNLLWQALAAEEWTYVVKALLHTLWLGGLAAGGLYFILRRKTDPATRYRWCVGALLAVVLGGIVLWAILEQQPTAGHPFGAQTPVAVALPTGKADIAPPVNAVATTPGPVNVALPGRWTPWLAAVWLGGVAAMLARAGSLVAQAERLRRKGHPLENAAVLRLIEEARGKLGLARRVRVVVTEQLTSPAVMGWLTPVLILPLSMLTTLPLEQVQLILLHELAHIRRGDYLVNLCQLVAESLLFFNPAVWWISRQIRQEREACCDAMAIALAGERLQYARTLAEMAGHALAAAPAFGDRRNPSGLKDRIQRLLVPGYRPALRLTWSALLAALFVGGGLLFLSAVGTRFTVAAILSPQERIDRIEKKMTEMGESPETMDFRGDWGKIPKITVSGRLRMADGKPVPKWVSMDFVSVVGHSSSGQGNQAQNGIFSNLMPAGTIYIGAEVTNFAPAQVGPLVGTAKQDIANVEIIFNPGFDATIQLVDTSSGLPVAGGKLSAQFLIRGVGQTSFRARALTTDENGSAVLTHAADLPLWVSVNVPGYEMTEQHFESVQPDKPLRVPLRAGAKVSGMALDKATGLPIAGATVWVRFQKGPVTEAFTWGDARCLLATTDESGRFVANQLRTDTVYSLGVSAARHESIVLSGVHPDDVLEARLGPELVVKGRVTGNLDQLQSVWGRKGVSTIDYSIVDDPADNQSIFGGRAMVRIEDGVGYFEFTNQAPGKVEVRIAGQTIERTVDAPVSDWLIDLDQLSNPAATNTPAAGFPKREVIFRFKVPSGPPPHGTASVEIQDPSELIRHTAHVVEMEITNGEIHVEIPVGGNTGIEAKSMVGYWFNHFTIGDNGGMFVAVRNGTGPMVIEIPLHPAGAIYAKARNADGTPAGGLSFGVTELKRAPGREESPLEPADNDGISDGAPRQWVASPLPLGGTYQIYGWRGNLFCVSKSVKLTEANPDPEIVLQFPPGKSFAGVVLDADGKPLRGAELKPEFLLSDERSFRLKSVFSDDRGRFQIEGMSPETGEYSVEVDAPGARSENIKLNFGSQPQSIRLHSGHTLAGRVVQTVTGYAIPDAEVRALDFDHTQQPMVTTRTDADGRFKFTTLGTANYTLFVAEAQLNTDKKFRADGNTNVLLSVQLYDWSKSQPKAPQ